MQDQQFIRDFLTGVYSRQAFESRLAEESARALRYKSVFSILVIDIDYFKTINDTHGHIRGDQVLKEFAERLLSEIRDSDLVFRYGGDEFVLLLPNSSMQQARKFAERFATSLKSSPFTGDPPLHLSVCTGIASFPDDVSDPQRLFEAADLRMLDGKRKGRGLVVDQTPKSQIDLPFDALSRPFERETQMQSANRFFDRLAETKRGIMIIYGPIGSGRSRFLREVYAMTRVHAIEIISMTGTPALRKRKFHTFTSARRDIRLNLKGCKTPQAYVRAVEIALTEQKIERLALLIDDIEKIDPDTLAALSLLLQSPLPVCIGICFTMSRESRFDASVFRAPVREMIELAPMSRESIRIWIRNLLQWEAPEEFVQKIYSETGGLPGNFRKALSFLTKRGTLKKEGNSWSVTRNFYGMHLAQRLAFKPITGSTSLPSFLTPFFGRNNEIQEITRFLKTSRLITITGPGGTGKTRLALHVASEQLPSYRHGCHFIGLASIPSSEMIAPAVAESLHLTFPASGDPKTQLLNYLHDQHCLLILDNFEHLQSGASFIAELLEKCPEITIMTTSCHKLRIRGESILELKGMPVPITPAEFDSGSNSAVQLFVQSARYADYNFVPTTDDIAQIIRICKLVEGFPLGIELAAAWVRVLSCSMIADEIERNLDFLETCSADLPARQHSLRAVFEYSWNLLTETEKEAYARLSIFRGGFNLDAARIVADVPPALLISLIDKSLVVHSGPDRYMVMEILRQYAESKLQKNDEETSRLMTMHSAYYVSLLESALGTPSSAIDPGGIDRVYMESENLRHGWHSAFNLMDPQLIDRYIKGMSSYYDRTGMYSEAESLCSAALSQITGNMPEDTVESEGIQHVIGSLHTLLGSFRFGLSVFDKARESFAHALQIFTRLNDLHEIAGCLNSLGDLASRCGDLHHARQYYEKSLQLRRQNNDLEGIASSLNNLAGIQSALGDNKNALNLYEESLEIVRKLNDKKSIATLTANVGIISGVLGDLQKEQKFLKDSYTIREEIGDCSGIADSLDNLAGIEFFKGNDKKAREMLLESLRIRRDGADRRAVARSLLNLGRYIQSPEDLAERMGYLTESLDIFKIISDRCGMATAMSLLGECLCQQGDCEKGWALLEEASRIFQETGDKNGSIQNLVQKAKSLIVRNNGKEAKKILRQAILEALRIDSVQLAADALMEYGTFLATGSLQEKEFAVTVMIYLKHSHSMSKNNRETIQHHLKTLETELPASTYFIASEYGRNISLDQLIEKFKR